MKQTYRQIFSYLKSKKTALIIACSIFFISFLVGVIEPNFFREFQDTILNSILSELEGKSTLQLTKFIIINNTKAALIAILLGIFFFIFPALIIIMNGYLIGAVATRALTEMSIWEVLSKIVPHGIFELPALLIAYTLSITISLCWLKPNKKHNFWHEYKHSLKVYFAIIVPLLIIAGIIEGMLVSLL